MPSMNPELLSFAFTWYTTVVFLPDFTGSIPFNTGIFPYLRYFLTISEAIEFHNKTGVNKWNARGYLRILNKFREEVRRQFGQDIECKDCHKKVSFKMKLAWDFESIASIEPVQTVEYNNFEEMIGHHLNSVSKIAIKRTFPIIVDLGLEIPYFHTGIVLQRRDGGVDIIEVVVEGPSARLEMENSATALERNACDEPEMLLDTREIGQTGNLNVQAVLFKIAALRETPISYNVFEFNCDHFANFILFDRNEWTTKKFHVPSTFHYVPNFPFGRVTEDTFESLRNHSIIHDGIRIAGATES